MKRFYKEVSVKASKESDAWEVYLGGHVLKSPAKRALSFQEKALAEALAVEWDSQGDVIDPLRMPLMTLVCTAVDWVRINRQEAVESLVDYGAHDSICYWSDQAGALMKRQEEQWQKLLTLSADFLDAPLNKTTGLLSVDQPRASLARFHSLIESFNDLQLSALLSLVREGGSLVVGLLALKGLIGEEQALKAVLLHDQFQAERWGADEEAEKRMASLKKEFAAVFHFLTFF